MSDGLPECTRWVTLSQGPSLLISGSGGSSLLLLRFFPVVARFFHRKHKKSRSRSCFAFEKNSELDLRASLKIAQFRARDFPQEKLSF